MRGPGAPAGGGIRQAGGKKHPVLGAQWVGSGARSVATVARSPKVPHRVHPLGDMLRILEGLGAPLHHEEGGLRQQGHEQGREQRLYFHPPAGLQQQLSDGSGGLRGREWGVVVFSVHAWVLSPENLSPQLP